MQRLGQVLSELKRLLVGYLRDIIAGAIIFWTPDFLMKALGIELYGNQWIAYTCVTPVISIAGLLVSWKFDRKSASCASIAVAMMFGIWFFGPLIMMIGASFSGGGFAQPTWVVIPVIVLAMVVPIYTFIMSTYDGSLFALLLTTAGLALFALPLVIAPTAR